ncbi:hypothetical protein B0H19DRAFT_1348307 [Mycena capillaripes]|nr:hypothetical protein B0H19DRAFT_1348307 [Mycena capillaripes]
MPLKMESFRIRVFFGSGFWLCISTVDFQQRQGRESEKQLVAVIIKWKEGQDSACSRVISILELYEQVLFFVAQDKGNRSKRDERSLARLARVSKTTSGPALDTLWAKLTDPGQLLGLLPDDALIKVAKAGFFALQRPYQWALRRPLVESDFVVFDKYAPRVQSIHLPSSIMADMTAGYQLFGALKAFRDPILPHLLDFEWEAWTRYNTIGGIYLISRGVPRNRFALTMYGPRLKKPLSPEPSEAVTLFNQPLSMWLPDVRILELHTGEQLAKPVLLEGLKRQTDLRQFHSRVYLGAEILAYLGGLPHLEVLDIIRQEPQSITDAGIMLAAHGSPSFPSLEILNIRGEYAVLSAFIPLITSCYLITLSIELGEFIILNFPLFSSLATLPAWLSTLRHFTFSTPRIQSYRRDIPHVMFSFAAFSALYQCVNLETFDIHVDAHEVEFRDADVEKMANAWPRLTSLRVVSQYIQWVKWSAPQVHLYTLWSLAQKCPQLRDIELAINAEVDGPFSPPQGHPDVCAYGVRTLRFWISPCAPGAHVASFLIRIFPNIEKVMAGSRIGIPSEWEIVTKAIQDFKTANLPTVQPSQIELVHHSHVAT